MDLAIFSGVRHVYTFHENSLLAEIMYKMLRYRRELSQLFVQTSLQRGHFDSIFQVQGVASHQSFLYG